jgi:hypothetical protein
MKLSSTSAVCSEAYDRPVASGNGLTASAMSRKFDFGKRLGIRECWLGKRIGSFAVSRVREENIAQTS